MLSSRLVTSMFLCTRNCQNARDETSKIITVYIYFWLACIISLRDLINIF